MYGALKYGQPSSSILANTGNGYAKFWCRATTTQKLPLVIATRYNIPFLLNKPGVGYYVTGEIYEVSRAYRLGIPYHIYYIFLTSGG